jgi:RNA polymerase sigma-70 factor (ECF subfamily)
MVAMNRAIALGYADGAMAGVEALLKLEGLEKNHFYHAALGDFWAKKGDVAKAKESYEKALHLAQLPAERKVMETKMEKLGDVF